MATMQSQLTQNEQPSITDTTRPLEKTATEVIVVHQGGQTNIFDLQLAQQREAKRRLAIVGILVQEDLDKKRFRAQAQAHFLPEQVLASWMHDVRLHGVEGLIPQDWKPLSPRSQSIVTKRLAELGPSLIEQLAQGKGVLIDEITALALRQHWSSHKAERLVRRYQINGTWGLAPEYDPERMYRQREKPEPPDFAEASQEARNTAEKRYELIKPWLDKKHIPNEDLRVYAQAHHTSLETLRKYLRDYRTSGLKRLLPCEQRSDVGKRHAMSPRMQGIVAGLRFSQRDLPVREVYERACPRARLLGEPEPTLWQVRQICDDIAEEVKEIADGRFGDYRSKHRMTYRYHFDGSVIVYQIDFTPVDVLLKDIREKGFHTKSGETRAHLITCVECSSRLIMGYLFTYDVPNSSDIAKVLHMALTTSENKPYGGIPDAVWVDGGKQLISKHMQRIANDFGFELRQGHPNFDEDRGDPQKRGRVERPFRTFNTRLWSTLDGYTGSNTKERHPDVKGTLTISDLVAEFKTFLHKYHNEEHSATKQTPLAFWNDHCFPRLPPPGDITMLLQEAHTVTTNKGIIQYARRQYWNEDLYEIANKRVEIRVQPKYMRPDDIEVIYDKKWFCRATAIDSEAGRKVSGKRVLLAQQRQRKAIQQKIDANKAALEQADQQIRHEAQQMQSQTPTSPEVAVEHEESQQEQRPPSQSKKTSQTGTPQPRKMPATHFSTTPQQAKRTWERVLEMKKSHKKRKGA